MFKQKLTKIGNSVGLIVPKQLRDLVGLSENSEVFLEASPDNNSIFIKTKETETTITPEILEIIDEATETYKDALKELASK